MSLKDGEDPQWSSNSCDEYDLEEYEARLYSMVYHNSNTYDDEPTPSPCFQVDLNSTADDNQRSGDHIKPVQSASNVVIDLESSNSTDINQDKFHQSSRNKVSRLDQVNEIIEFADKRQSRREKPAGRKNRLDTKNRNTKNMHPKRQPAHTEVPKTASLYFQNLTKSLNNVQYFQSVEPRLPKPFDPFLSGPLPSRTNSPHKTPPGNSCLPLDRTALMNFTFSEMCNKTTGIAPVFRLDDRLFPNVPRNRPTCIEEFELSHRLFSNKPNEAAPVDRDRHNHLFNQLPTIPIPSIPMTKKDRHSQKNKSRRDNAKAKRKNCKSSPSSAPGEVLPSLGVPQPSVDVVLPAVVRSINAILGEEDSKTDVNDYPVAVFDTGNMALKESKVNADVIINLDSSLKVEEIINLDSDSDTAESIVVLTPPTRTPPPLIALEISDEETPTENDASDNVGLHPLLETEHVENSFDFLDSSDEIDGLKKSQVSLFSNLISNSGSKESLLDDRFFQRHEEFGVEGHSPSKSKITAEPNMPVLVQEVFVTDGHSASRSNSMTKLIMPVLVKDPSTSKVKPQFRQIEQDPEEDTLAHPSVVNVDESSQSVESVESVSSSVKSTEDVTLNKKHTLILNVQDNMYVDLEINNILDEVSGNVEKRVLQEPNVFYVGKKGKRKHGQRDQEDESNSNMKKRKKPGKKSREKTRQQLHEFLKNRTGMEPVVYTKIFGGEYIDKSEVRPRNPPQWTREMRHFYNDSWGGENFDVQEVQRTLPKDQALWRISWEDRRGPVPMQGPFRRSRCYNCSRFGHAAFTCPEPHRVSKCHMCGEQGHREPTCPNKICLQCGRPTPKYSNGCWECQHVAFNLCTKCIWKHDPSSNCFDVRHNPVSLNTSNSPQPEPSGQHPLRPSGSTSFKPQTHTNVGQTLEECDLRAQLDDKRSRFGQHSLDRSQARAHELAETSGSQRNRHSRLSEGGFKRGREPTHERTYSGDPYFNKRKSIDSHRSPNYGDRPIPVFRKQSFRRSRP